MVNCFHSFKTSWRLRSIRLLFQSRAFFYTKIEKQNHIRNLSKKSALVKWAASSLLLGYGIYEHDAIVWYAEVASRTILTAFTVAQIIFDYRRNYISSSNNLDLKLESEMTPSELAEFRSLEMMHSCIHERNAAKLLKIVQKLGGIYIKLGQHIAALDYLLPPEYTRKFKILQDAAPQSSMDQVRRVIESEYKLKIGISRLEDVFDVFEEAPIGTASLAQVHRARLRRSPDSYETEIEPKWVAVKVQHGNLSRTASMDLAVVRQAVKVSKWLIPGFSLEWLAQEMQRNLPLEMDFFHEAKNAETLQDFISKDRQGSNFL